MKPLHVGLLIAAFLAPYLLALGCSDNSLPPRQYAYVEIESDGQWSVGVGWKPDSTTGLIVTPMPGSGNQVVRIGEVHSEPGLFCVLITRLPETGFVKARIIVPWNPEAIRDSGWQSITPPDTVLDLCHVADPP